MLARRLAFDFNVLFSSFPQNYPLDTRRFCTRCANTCSYSWVRACSFGVLSHPMIIKYQGTWGSTKQVRHRFMFSVGGCFYEFIYLFIYFAKAINCLRKVFVKSFYCLFAVLLLFWGVGDGSATKKKKNVSFFFWKKSGSSPAASWKRWQDNVENGQNARRTQLSSFMFRETANPRIL